MKITICGGGGQGHVLSAVLAQEAKNDIYLFTGHPQRWNNHLEVRTCDGKILSVDFCAVSDNPSIVAESDIVLISVPGFCIREKLAQIKPYLKQDTIVGCVVASTGFFFQAHEILDSAQPIFAFQRVPFISFVEEYGKRGNLAGYKSQLYIAAENIVSGDFATQLSLWLKTPIEILNNFWEATMTNSNPLLHTVRLYTLWKDWTPGIFYDENPFMYNFDVETAENLIACDNEFMQVISRLPIVNRIPSLLEYYESTDAQSLARKICSIDSFKGIKAPMLHCEKGYYPDTQHRYFQEDFNFGLKYIKQVAENNHIVTPVIDQVMEWAKKIM